MQTYEPARSQRAKEACREANRLPLPSARPTPLNARSSVLARFLLAACLLPSAVASGEERPRIRHWGISPGVLRPGAENAITDVAGVRVGHRTLVQGDEIRTGVTAVLPHGGNLFQQKVPAAVYVGNGFGKAAGFLQIQELGNLETPIVLTNTLAVGRAVEAVVQWTLAQPGNEEVRSVNAVVGETNDGFLNNIRRMSVTSKDVHAAIMSAASGPVAEGSVGAGTGTICMGFKGGIGTSSRKLPSELGGYTVGALVQTNFGGVLTIDGRRVGEERGRYAFRRAIEADRAAGIAPVGRETPQQDARPRPGDPSPDGVRRGEAGGERPDGANQETESKRRDPQPLRVKKVNELDRELDRQLDGDGSVMIVLATDAPLTSRHLERLAKRAILGLARTGSFMSNGSGDFVIAFSTRNPISHAAADSVRQIEALENEQLSPLFLAAVEAVEESVYNSLARATTVTGYQGRTVEALEFPLEN